VRDRRLFRRYLSTALQHLLTANDCSQASQTVQQHVTELADLSVQQQVKGTTQYLRPQLQAE